MDLGLEGKAALVGGASKGIGKAVAQALAREGCRVAICARNEVTLRVAAEEVRSATGGEIIPILCDMAKHDDIKRAVAQAVEAFGRLDILVNNAGGPPTG